MLRSKDLGDTITEDNNSSDKDKYRAIYMIRHHLQENLKTQYDHQKTVLLPKAQYDWKHIRFLDYKSVDEYNSVLFRIVSLLRLCGEKVTAEEMLNKTLSTFPQTNMVLQQQYRERNFATYTELIECLLLAEANNELLLKNSEMRPPGTAPLPDISKLAIEPKKESNLVQHNDHPGPNRGRSQGRGRGSFKAHGRGRGRGTTPGFSRGRGRGRSVSFKPQIKADRCHRPLHTSKSLCHRCGMDNNWAKNCRTPKHLCELYQESIKNKNPEANMIQENGHDDKGYGYDADDESDRDNKDDQMDFETSDCIKD
ncbi:hypothetical protein Bca101_035456 [Brassica carinata]